MMNQPHLFRGPNIRIVRTATAHKTSTEQVYRSSGQRPVCLFGVFRSLVFFLFFLGGASGLGLRPWDQGTEMDEPGSQVGRARGEQVNYLWNSSHAYSRSPKVGNPIASIHKSI